MFGDRVDPEDLCGPRLPYISSRQRAVQRERTVTLLGCVRDVAAWSQYGEGSDESWGASSDDGGQAAPYNSGMTTLTATSSGTIPERPVTQLWRFVATFAAGVALASGVAVGIHAVQDNGTAARPPAVPVHVTPAIAAAPGCRVRVPGPC